MYNSANSVQKV